VTNVGAYEGDKEMTRNGYKDNGDKDSQWILCHPLKYWSRGHFT